MSQTPAAYLMALDLKKRGATVRTEAEVAEISARIDGVYRTAYTALMFALITPIGVIGTSAGLRPWIMGALCLVAGVILVLVRPSWRAQAPPRVLVHVDAHRERARILRSYFPRRVRRQKQQLEQFAGGAYVGVYGNRLDHYLVIRPEGDDEWLAVYQWGMLRVFAMRDWPWTRMHEVPRRSHISPVTPPITGDDAKGLDE